MDTIFPHRYLQSTVAYQVAEEGRVELKTPLIESVPKPVTLTLLELEQVLPAVDNVEQLNELVVMGRAPADPVRMVHVIPVFMALTVATCRFVRVEQPGGITPKLQLPALALAQVPDEFDPTPDSKPETSVADVKLAQLLTI
jgi:hypothetical protein